MYCAEIKYDDIANGPGVRTTLFVSGCRLHCPGCFNEIAWNFKLGEEFTDEIATKVIDSVRPEWISGLTLLGGEPMEPENRRDLIPFLKRFRKEVPDKNIWCFTGYTLEDLVNTSTEPETVKEILYLIDVLVDGPWVEELHDISLKFRGSSNQRIIDMVETIKQGRIIELD